MPKIHAVRSPTDATAPAGEPTADEPAPAAPVAPAPAERPSPRRRTRGGTS